MRSSFPRLASTLAAAWLLSSTGSAHPAASTPATFTLDIVARTRNVTDVVQAADGTLWFIAEGRVCRFDGGSGPDCLDEPLRARRLLALPEGGVMVASDQPTSFFAVADPSGASPIGFNPSLATMRINDLCWWKGMAWAAAGSRLMPVLAKDAAVAPMRVPEEIVSAAANATGPLYVASERGLFRLESPEATATAVQNGDVTGRSLTALAIDAKGDVWIGTRSGLWRNGHVVPQNFQLEATFSSRPLDAVLVDREGSIWVAAAVGLAQLRVNSPVRVFAAADGLGGEIPFSVHALADDDVWLAHNYGVSQWNGVDFNNFGSAAGFGGVDLRTLAPNPDGGMWIGGMSSGLWHLHKGKARHVDLGLASRASSGVRTLMTDAKGQLWVGFEKGGLALRSPAGDVTHIPLVTDGHPPLVGPLVEHEGQVWVGFRDGGFGRVVNGSFERLGGNAPEFPASTPVFSFAFEGTSDAVWLATYGQGLWRYSQGNLHAIKVEDGLPSNNVYSVTRDHQGRLWAGTDTGVFVVSVADANARVTGRLAKLSVVAFDHRDGMRSIEAVRAFAPPVAMTSAGKLWQPTPNGVAVFDTTELPPRSSPPNLIISSLTMNGNGVRPDVISVPAGAGDLEARLLAPTYLYPHRLVLQHRVRALDGERETPWLPSPDDRRIVVRNLSPGSYVLQARAFYSDDPTQISMVSRPFTLKPRFYNTSPFYIALVLLAALVTALAYKRRTSRMRQSFELVLTERRRISRDMHDSLQQDLVGLKYHIETALITGGIGDPARVHLEKAAALAVEGVRDLRDAIDGLTAAALSVAALEQHVSQQIDRLFAGSGTATSVRRTGGDANLSVYVATAVSQMTREALTNVHKHAAATQLVVTFTVDANSLELTIEDNGRGAASENLGSPGRGMENMRHRANEAGIKLSIDTAQGRGCRVTLNAPTSRDEP